MDIKIGQTAWVGIKLMFYSKSAEITQGNLMKKPKIYYMRAAYSYRKPRGWNKEVDITFPDVWPQKKKRLDCLIIVTPGISTEY